MTRRYTTRIDGLSRALLAFGETAGLSLVDAQGANVDALADCEHKIADATRVDWVEGAIRRHADLTRNLTRRYATTARGFIS